MMIISGSFNFRLRSEFISIFKSSLKFVKREGIIFLTVGKNDRKFDRTTIPEVKNGKIPKIETKNNN